MIKLVAFDMDGTFLRSDNTYDVEHFEKIYRTLQDKDIKVVVISGNQYAQLVSFFPEHQSELIIVSENGALIFEGEKLLREEKIARIEIEKVLDVLVSEGLENGTTLYRLHFAYLLQSAPKQYKEEITIYYHALKEISNFQDLPEDDFVKLALLVPEEKTNQLLEKLNQATGQLVQAVSSGHGSIDIIQRGVHKGSALEFLSQHFGIAPQEMMAFGDGGNDLEMLAYVGHSYAMKNGSEIVKRAAKYQAPSNQESGVLAVLEQEIAK
ncbi:Flavin mononucleotide phosphatase YbjI [Streptococcus constellatus]|uniref:Flavin mononucleotide phosphatase YbjI n=1 Tax=Streptococcus constellatus TaxID=76860 RepID=A0A564SS38_STRCV|nr:Cof-type HAD-IIB family hydrolase [Streptococcus constellatus]VUW93129.1 Flavin mononucleotide phosphatase YbjI [Streptococcus gordonii]VUW97210.1 Flavin mononucleotide phosphatase YbjI [Streptococcus constellatus]